MAAEDDVPVKATPPVVVSPPSPPAGPAAAALMRPSVPPVAPDPVSEDLHLAPKLRQCFDALLAGRTVVKDIAAAIGSTSGGVHGMLFQIRKMTGFHHTDVAGLRAWAVQRTAKPPPPAQKEPTPPPAVPSPAPPPQPKPGLARAQQVADDGTNGTWYPTDVRSVELGRTLVEPFTSTDVAARLDDDGIISAQTRAYQWIASWKRMGWIETVGFQQYRRTAKFGD